MTSYAEFAARHLRLSLLRLLLEDADYAHNELVLSLALAQLGHGVSQDRLRTELEWLAEQGLIALEDVSGLRVARLSGRGADAARGLARVPGVARPRPGGG